MRYELPDFTNPALAAEAWAEQYRRAESAEAKILLDQPKVEFYDTVTSSEDTIEIGEAAKVLSIKGYGRNNLFRFLRDNKILRKNNQPYQIYIDAGWFRLVEVKWTDQNLNNHIYLKTVVYQKGLDEIRKLIAKQ